MYLTLGVGAGGINDFPDDYVSNGVKKPWSNKGRRNLRDFVDNLNNWLNTWKDDQEIMKVNYVKITAL